MRAAAFCALLFVGCGSASVADLPPPAEPARSPALERPPAGRVLTLADRPEGVAVDPRSGVLAVGVSDPAALVLLDGRTLRARHRVALPGAPRHVAAAGGRFLVRAESADRYVEVTPAGRRRTAVVGVAGEPGGVSAAGGLVAVVSVRERVLELFDPHAPRRVARAPAGVGPTHVAAAGPWIYVVDTDGGALLVFRIAPELELVRRYPLPGSPYGIALDPVRRRLWVTLTARNELVELPAHGRPHALRRFATVRQPNGVAIDASTGRAFVTGRADRGLQVIDVR
jgi:DNA-binding beta-propeller fold protein YncE